MSKLSLGIDVGTSGVRTAVIDRAGSVLATARVPHSPTDPDRIDAMDWDRAVQACLRAQVRTMANAGLSADQIAHICVDGTSGTVVFTDADLVPVTRALLYNSGNFNAEAERIARFAPNSHITRGSGSALARTLKLLSEDTDNRAVHLLHQADFVAGRLLGRGGISDFNNSLKTGFDPETKSWPNWISLTGLSPSLLPVPLPVGSPIGAIDPDVAERLGLPSSITIHAGTTDSIAAFLAVAPIEPGVAVTSLGTTLAVKLLSAKRIDAPDLGLYSHCLGDRWLVGGASNTGGGVLLDYFTQQQLLELSAQIDPTQPSEFDYYPLSRRGERFPVNDPFKEAELTPRPDNDAAFLHGLLESIARIEKQCYDTIADLGGSYPTTLYTAGGGASNQIWTRIRQRVLGLKILTPVNNEAAVGAARCAFING